jgi:hypothetical protein
MVTPRTLDVDAFETRELRRLSRRLGAHSITLRDAVTALYGVYLAASRARAAQSVTADMQASTDALAVLDRRLGDVVVPARPVQAPTRPQDLW